MRPEIAIDRRIAGLAHGQHGVVSLRQLEEAGLSARAVRHRARYGRLHRMHRGVYAVGHARLTAEGRWMAAVLACGPGAVLSHRAAGAHHGLRPSASPIIDVTVPGSGGRSRRPPIVVHRSLRFPADDVTVERGIPVTTPARTLLDLGELVDARSLLRALERAETLGVFDLRRIEALIAANPRRRGARALARSLGEYDPAIELTRTELERLFLELCAAYGLPRPQVNVPIGPYEVDFLWPDRRLIVEVDGYATHGTRAAFERDRARDAWLIASGYLILRFTYLQVTRERGSVAATVRSVLASQPERSISSTR